GAGPTNSTIAPAQIVCRFALGTGMVPLTGPRSRVQRHEDLGVFDFWLRAGEVEAVDRVVGCGSRAGSRRPAPDGLADSHLALRQILDVHSLEGDVLPRSLTPPGRPA